MYDSMASWHDINDADVQGEKLPELLKEVFSEVDDGDGLLTKE